MKNADMKFFKEIYLKNKDVVLGDDEYKYLFEKCQDIFTLLYNSIDNKHIKKNLYEYQNTLHKLLVCHGGLSVKLGIDKLIEAEKGL